MATIKYRLNDDAELRAEFTKELRIGSDRERNQLVLPAAAGVAAEHAIITRAVVGKLPVLVDLAGHSLRVNRQTVVSLKVLHHGDKIQVGNAQLELREMQIRIMTNASYSRCPVCTNSFELGAEIVCCPNCQAQHHKVCWFSVPRCSIFACQYPIHETVIQALSPPCNFITKLEKSSKLVLKQKACAASQQRDVVPFQENNDVAFCPSCEAALHLECWLNIQKCPSCRYDIKKLIDNVFDAPAPAAVSQLEIKA